MKKEEENWKEHLKNMSKALEEMRVNYDRNFKLKNFESAQNPLLKRRMEKHKNEKVIRKPVERKQNEIGNTAKILNREISPKIRLNRVQSVPASRTPLTAFYYTSNLKDNFEPIDNP